jgi:hypothetical protein
MAETSIWLAERYDDVHQYWTEELNHLGALASVGEMEQLLGRMGDSCPTITDDVASAIARRQSGAVF